MNDLKQAEEKLSHVKSIEIEAQRMAEELVELALENVLNLGEKIYLAELSNMAQIRKRSLLEKVKEALQ